jgi:hypothetical protein
MADTEPMIREAAPGALASWLIRDRPKPAGPTARMGMTCAHPRLPTARD